MIYETHSATACALCWSNVRFPGLVKVNGGGGGGLLNQIFHLVRAFRSYQTHADRA